MNGFMQDLHYGLRQLRRSPGFTTVAVLTLALGIGANTGIFTLVNAVLLKSLPVAKPEQIYLVSEDDRFAENTRFSYPLFQNAQAAAPADVEVAAMTWPGDFYAGFTSGQREMVQGQLVSGNYFQTLGTYPALGRLLSVEDDRVIDGSPVAVISYGCWERRFASDRSVIGRKIMVNGVPFAVIGVAAPGFFGARVGTAPEFWLPTAMQSAVRYAQHYSQSEAAQFDKPWVRQRDIRWLQWIVRVKGRDAVRPAESALNQVFRQDREQAAASIKDPEERQAYLRSQLHLEPGSRGLSSLRHSFSQPLLVLMAVVAVVLVIACANLANLLLARAASRQRELAVRMSMGASPGRLIRQLLTECVLLSVAGTVLGIAVAYWCRLVLPQWASGGATPIPLDFSPDARVLLFSTSIAFLTGILFGLAPAIEARYASPLVALKSGANRAVGRDRKGSLKQVLVAAQVALSLVLLAGAGLFLRTLGNYAQVDPGFERDHILTVWLDTHLAGYSPAELALLYQRLIDRLQAVPGVRSAALTTCGLASGCRDASDIYLPGVPHSHGETDSQESRVSQRFFATTGIPLIEGRDFRASDTEKSPPVVIVNQAFVREFLNGKDALGQYFGYDADNPHRFQIVGVVRDARVNDIREAAPPMAYHLLTQDLVDVDSLEIRTPGDPARLISQVRESVRSVDPNLPAGGITTLTEQIANNLAQQRLIARVTSIFGGLALALACLGVYGVMSCMAARRTAELGVRLALGASRAGVLWLLLRQILVLVGTGLLAGLLLSFASVPTVSSLLFGLSPYDPATLAAATVLLLLVSIAAGLKPALRAAKVEPVVALRYE